ncbi:hypothetical protein KIPB_007760, partial [Kipferlia bialata]|eukprot:g7760.t1
MEDESSSSDDLDFETLPPLGVQDAEGEVTFIERLPPRLKAYNKMVARANHASEIALPALSQTRAMRVDRGQEYKQPETAYTPDTVLDKCDA